MLKYIEEATNLLGAVWGDAKSNEIRTYLKAHLSYWSVDEQEDLLTLCATLANWHAEGAREAAWEAERRAREHEDAARQTSKNLSRFKLREKDKRETERRQAIIERHFGAALRGEAPRNDPDEDDA
ncbi:hypothetical protein Q8W71_29175 [Methylobacterium sp. NEAU 140]|uniref:hypothetical protein n=1 Tax=Methylobacterium sp. NEAU 140 TaxID=3064945 RepID=UPI002736DCFE|nr:hypothetical protein [Methylobacterium sp. NEAU 140]MDP4026683.1 hypothetical protein [Methylobacterium sp. NEAU 140]